MSIFKMKGKDKMVKKYKDIQTGDKFGNWTILDSNNYEQKKGYKKYLCKCGCINQTIKYVDERNLKNNSSIGCGKCGHKIIQQGDKFGLWTTLEYESTSSYIMCKCNCGKEKKVDKRNLLAGSSRSCGCLQKQNNLVKNQFSNLSDEIIIGHMYHKWKVLKKVKISSYLCECSCFNHTRKILKRNELLSKSNHDGCKKCRLIKYHTGETFGYLTIGEIDIDATKQHSGIIYVNAHCKCGNNIITEQSSIIRGRTMSCGCKKHEYNNEEKFIGKRFGHLTVIKFLGRDYYDNEENILRFKCKCDCGNETIVSKGNLIYGSTWSCGCMKRSHGEKMIYDFLSKNNFCFEEQYRIKNCKNKLPLPFDFAIFNNKYKLSCLIEFDGKQHFEPFQFNKCSKLSAIENYSQCLIRDEIKTNYCKNNKIPLLRVTYEDLESGDLLYILWDFLEKRKLIKKEQNNYYL